MIIHTYITRSLLIILLHYIFSFLYQVLTPFIHFFFFLIIRPPPKSPLFPYPTLFRSFVTQPAQPIPHVGQGKRLHDLGMYSVDRLIGRARRGQNPVPRLIGKSRQCRLGEGRSEEHTSELQSPCNLVCRLLLEKKKQSR